jgi:hypothetical protein
MCPVVVSLAASLDRPPLQLATLLVVGSPQVASMLLMGVGLKSSGGSGNPSASHCFMIAALFCVSQSLVDRLLA